MQQGSDPMSPPRQSMWAKIDGRDEGKLMRLGKIEIREISPLVFPGDAGARRDVDFPCSFLFFEVLPMGHDMLLNNQSRQIESRHSELRKNTERMPLSRCLSLFLYSQLLSVPTFGSTSVKQRADIRAKYPTSIPPGGGPVKAQRWKGWRNRTLGFHGPPAIFPRSSDPPPWAT